MEATKDMKTWKEFLEDTANEPDLWKSVPDYIVANIKKLKDTENTTLRQIAAPIELPISYEVSRQLVQLKWKFENDDNCFSLSAPQLGFPIRAMCFFKPRELKKIEKKDKRIVYTLINPTYEPLDDEMDMDYEKCPSVKKLCGLVKRYQKIRYTAYDVNGNFMEQEAEGVIARWIQHEIDHMNGILFIDQAANLMTIKEHRWRRRRGLLDFILDLPGW